MSPDPVSPTPTSPTPAPASPPEPVEAVEAVEAVEPPEPGPGSGRRRSRKTAAAAGPADALPQRTAAAFAGWLAAHVGEPSAEARAANAMAEVIDTDPEVVRPEDVALRLAVSTRTLQRLAHRYVGLPPAAMIRRRRLQEAAERVRTDPSADLARIAAELGYADHGHLTRDFRAVLGMAPSEYRRGGGAG